MSFFFAFLFLFLFLFSFVFRSFVGFWYARHPFSTIRLNYRSMIDNWSWRALHRYMSNGYVDDHIGWEKIEIQSSICWSPTTFRCRCHLRFLFQYYVSLKSSKIGYRWDVNFSNAYTNWQISSQKNVSTECVFYLKWHRIEQKKLKMILYFDWVCKIVSKDLFGRNSWLLFWQPVD